MKSLKKLVVFLVVFAMVLSTLAPAFAAEETTGGNTQTTTPATATYTGPLTDIAGTDYEGAVSKLVALGIIAGYEDGTFKPANDITRAEFAKIAVYVVGQQKAAELSKGATKFSDVGADHWACGFINIAASNGLIKGYPDGTFKPGNKVTYAESITILVRALGYGKVVEENGQWPSNYLSKASDIGLMDGVSSANGEGNAVRGNIAKLAWNTLKADRWGETGYDKNGPIYGKLDNTLLKSKYSDYVKSNGDPKFYEDAVVVATSLVGGLEANKVRLEKEKIGVDIDNVAADNANANYTTKEVTVQGIDFYSLLGKKVDVLFGKDNKIVSLVVKSSATKEGIIEDMDVRDGSDTHNGKIKIAGTWYSLAKRAKMYVNTVDLTATGTDTEKDTNNGEAANGYDYVKATILSRAAKATAVLNDDGLISSLNIFTADVVTLPGLTMKQFVIKEITSETVVKDVATGTQQFKISDVEDKDKVNGYKTVIVKNGKKVAGSDLKVGDVVTYINNGSVYYIVASDAQIKGTVSAVSVDESAYDNSLRYKLTISDKVYKMARDGKAQMSRTASMEDEEAISDSIKDFLNKEATLYLNSLGVVVFVSGSVKSSAAAQYGVVTQAPWAGNPDANGDQTKYIKIKTSAGENKIFTVKTDDDNTTYKKLDSTHTTIGSAVSVTFETASGSQSPEAGTLVRYSLEADGTIKVGNLVAITGTGYDVDDSASDTYIAVGRTVTDVKKDTKMVTAGGVNYYVVDSTVLFNANTSSTEKVSWSQLVEGDGTANTILDASSGGVVIVYDKSNKIVKNLFGNWNSASYLSAEDKYAIFKEVKYNANGDQVIVLNVAGETKEYVVSQGVYKDSTVADAVYKGAVCVGDLIKYTINGDNKFVGGTDQATKYANFKFDRSYYRKDNIVNQSATSKISKVDKANMLLKFYKDEIDSDGNVVKLASDVVIYDVRNDSDIKTMKIDDLTTDMYAHIDYLKDGAYKVVVVYYTK